MANGKINHDNLHHAYLLEGEKERIIPEVLELMRALKLETTGNPDYLEISLDTFKIDDARNLKNVYQNKSTTGGKKIFVLIFNNFLVEAQNVLLKIFEDPTPETHFFMIVPDASIIIPTLSSRLYKISFNENLDLKEAEKFLEMHLAKRIDFIRGLLFEEEDAEVTVDSPKAKALRFLGSLEQVLHEKLLQKEIKDTDFFNQIFSVREFLRHSGSSTKTLMESVALAIPEF